MNHAASGVLGIDDTMDEQPDDPRWWLREHGPRLVLLARQYVGRHADAEDVLQEAFVRFWRHRDGAREPVAYLYRCVRNAAINWRRAEQRRKRHERHAATDRMFETVDEKAAEDTEDVAKALLALPEEQREVVVMKVWAGLTFDVISQLLEIPRGTVQSRYRYALQALRRALTE